MEQALQIHTDQSISMTTSRNSEPKQVAFRDSTNLIADKMISHLEFTQHELLRNIDWQKELISQIKSDGRGHPQVKKEKVSCDCFALSVN